MSHVVAFTDIVYPESCITDGSLAAALAELGMELVPGKKTWNWYGTWVKDYHETDAAYKQGINPETYGRCEHVIRPKDARSRDYEIGLVKNPRGEGYVPILDFFGPGNRLRDLVGDRGQHLATAYNRAAIRQQARREGATVTEERLPDGLIKMVVARYAGM